MPQHLNHRDREEDKKKDHKKILEEIIVENFPKMGKEIITQVQETQRVSLSLYPFSGEIIFTDHNLGSLL